MTSTEFWGLRILSEGVDDAASRVLHMAETHTAMPIRFLNANTIATATKDSVYRGVMGLPGTNYADGKPLAACLSVMARFGDGDRHIQVRGPALFEATLRRSQGSGVSHLFFGASEQTLLALRRNIVRRFPGVEVAGFVAPPIASADELVSLAKDAHSQHGGDIIWLGLGQPKQDIVAQQLAFATSTPCLGVGAAFDFVAEQISAAPVILQKCGLEWLYRFRQEPRRLWRRYTVGNLIFLKVAVQEMVVHFRRVRACSDGD